MECSSESITYCRVSKKGIVIRVLRSRPAIWGKVTKEMESMLRFVLWNCAGNPPPNNFDVQKILYDSNQKMSDIVMVGLQEMVDLKINQVIKGKDK